MPTRCGRRQSNSVRARWRRPTCMLCLLRHRRIGDLPCCGCVNRRRPLHRRNEGPAMIHVCSLARLHATVEETGACRVVTLLKDVHLVQRPRSVAPDDHLVLAVDDINAPADGYVVPAEEHVREMLTFVRGWDRAAPIVFHCYAGISR